MTKILVIGGASQDFLHINGKDIHTTGGAGLYTALGARAAGGQVDMLAPLPSPMPLLMQPINELINWLGPTVSQDELPHFAIKYDDSGKATYTTVEPRSESLMTENDIPSDLSNYTYVHIVQLGNIDVQLRMIKKCRDSKAQNISVSGGHNLQDNQKEKMSTLIEQADLCFMNEHEAASNLGPTKNICSPIGTILFVTHGENGVSIIQGNDLQRIPINPTDPRDPTGAGDSFCGAVLSYLCKLEHPVQAAKKAAKIAKITVSYLGTEGLMQQVSTTPTDSASQVSINTNKIRQIAKIIETEENGELPYTFTGMGQPAIGHPNTLDFFFALTLQQFGFWTKNNQKYVAPMIAKIDGYNRKGSDYIGSAYSRMLDSDPDFFSVNRQANL
ncbi:MAG: carbohydrate kinase family protein, partial [Anaerolineales bacterium]|nr:carbohydrate kinase family protein [Anaerolineales bacterium]